MSEPSKEIPVSGEPDIRWNKQAQVFLIHYGNVHMALTRAAAIVLGNALRKSVKELEATNG